MPRKKSWRVMLGRGTALFFILLQHGMLAQVAPAAPVPFSADRILIIPKAGHDAALAKQHAKERVQIHRKFPGLGNIHVLELPKGTDPREVVARYRRGGHVETADLDYHQWRPAATPNDPIYGALWQLNNIGQTGGAPDADIDAPEGWDILNSASNVVVAVLDTGARYTHDDLAANMWVNPGEISGNGVDDDGNGFVDDVHGIDAVMNNGNPIDDHWGHGTHVTGILGAVGNNGIGLCGVAWRVQLMICKFIGPTTGSDSDLIQSMDYAKANGAKVMNCSFVAPGPVSTSLSNAFWSVRNAGIVVVAAAGNSAADHDTAAYYPASFKMDNVVAVAATDSSDNLWSGSDYGAMTVHLAAPGIRIYSTWNSADNAYVDDSGTSMSAPCVAGVVALLRAKFPAETHQQIIARLFAGTDPLPGLAGKCVTGGRLNLKNALSTINYRTSPAIYDWVPTNGMTSIPLANDGVSLPQPLPFAFSFYAHSYNQLFIGANGLISFTNMAGLTNPANIDLPNLAAPKAAIYPYWDDLNPGATGSIWFGSYGEAPNRKAVVSWVTVPYAINLSPPSSFTFQIILHESGHIAFQYQQVETGHPAIVKGRNATVGVEDASGFLATKYSYNGSPALVTNNQAILFVPAEATIPSPSVTALPPGPGLFQLRVAAAPAQSCVIHASTNLTNWSPILTNTIPASGVKIFADSIIDGGPTRFYRAAMVP